MGSNAKVLLYDLEVTPTLAWTYRLFKANILKVERDQHLLCVTWKWLGEKTVHYKGLPDFPGYEKDKTNDKALAQFVADLFDEADIVCAHNAKKFDNKIMGERFFANGIEPPSPYRTIDTFQMAKQVTYHDWSLDALCRKLGISGKTKVRHHDVWYGCVHGDPKAWAAMKRYAKNDIVMLEAVYLALRPMVANHPTVAHGFACPRCGSYHLNQRGYRTTNALKYKRYRCMDCGGWCSDRHFDRDESKALFTTSVG